MDDDRVHADLLQQHHVAGEQPRRFLVAHGVAAIFDDEGAAIVLAHIWQRLGQGARLADPFLTGEVGRLRRLIH